MKKVLFCLLVSFLCLGLLSAQEQEGEAGMQEEAKQEEVKQEVKKEKKSIFSPSASISNSLKFSGDRGGEDGNKGNLLNGGMANTTTAQFGVGIAVLDGFKLTPYVSNQLRLKGGAQLNRNDFNLGLKGGYSLMAGMLNISFDTRYISRTKHHGLPPVIKDGSGKVISTSTANTMQAHGVKFATGVSADVEAFFLSTALNYSFTGMFADWRTGAGDQDYMKKQSFDNTIGVEFACDFFNFLRDWLNSGLTLSNEVTISLGKDINGKNVDEYTSTQEISNSFAAGLHFNPVKFMDFSFGTTVDTTFTKNRVTTKGDSFGQYVIRFGSSSAEKPEPYLTTEIGLDIGLELKKDNFTFGVGYAPTLAVFNTFKANKDAEVEKTQDKDLGQSLTIKFAFKL